MQFELPELAYPYDALTPHIDAQTMEIHHSKHHAGYTKKLNDALEEYPELASKGIEWLLRNLNELPEEIQESVQNNGGGYYNHSLFWATMSPNPSTEPSEALAKAIKKVWGSLHEFKSDFNAAAASQFGSGWAWLAKDQAGNLIIMATANQDNPLMEDEFLTPILGVDVWEHAYYLNYQNRRPDYIESWWNVVDWSKVSELYED